MTIYLKAGLTALLLAGATQALAVNVSLGASDEIFTLYGRGPLTAGIGSFDVGQGASSVTGGISTFLLSGAITGGDVGYNSGTYRFVTSYPGLDMPDAGPNAPFAQTNPSNPLFFFYRALHPSTDMTLFLDTVGGNYEIPLVVDGRFVSGTNFSFLRTASTCTGVTVCTQNNVGLTEGATIFGPVTIQASFTVATPVDPPIDAVPEPASWALLIAGFGLVGGAVRRQRKLATA